MDRGFKYLPDLSVEDQWLLFANDNELALALFPTADDRILPEFYLILFLYLASIYGAIDRLI